MTGNPGWSNFQRQPKPAFLLVLFKSFIKIAKGLWPFLLLMVFSKKQEDGFTIYLVTLLPLVILFFSVLEFLYFRFSVSGNQLLINKGVLKKKNLVLPFNKIQAVHIDQNWLHQLLDLAEVSFDSPGSDEAEVKIILEKNNAYSLKELIMGLSLSSASVENASQKESIAKLSNSDLFKLGISANHLETLAIMFGLGISFFNNIKSIIEDQFEDIFQQSTSDLLNGGAIFMIYMAVLIFFISVVVSFFRIVLKYANFNIFKTEHGFSVSSGLINTAEKAIPFKKVQFISWKTNWIRKKIPLYLFEYHSIGSSSAEKELKIKIPVTSCELIRKLADVYSPITGNCPYLKISKEYIFRTTLMQGILPFLVIGMAIFFYFNLQSVLAVAILPFYICISSYLFCKKFKLYYDNDMLHFRKGIYGVNDIILRWDKIQSVSVRQSLYQQGKDLATVTFFTAGGTLSVPFIALKDARILQDYALFKIENATGHWM